MKVKSITVKVTYRVGYGNVEMPKNVYNEIVKAVSLGDEISHGDSKYPDAADWLTAKIRERDCMDWEADIEDISTHP